MRGVEMILDAFVLFLLSNKSWIEIRFTNLGNLFFVKYDSKGYNISFN